MAEVLLQFGTPLIDGTGVIFTAQICGGLAEDELWEGWIEFAPHGAGTTLRTPLETKQPNRNDLEYWATGLTVAYLEGALDRARRSSSAAAPPAGEVNAIPECDRPASSVRPPADSSSAPLPDTSGRVTPRSHAVLDPFAVYAQGEDVLRKELNALDAGHLRNVIRAYGLVKGLEVDLDVAERSSLAEAIVADVRDRAG